MKQKLTPLVLGLCLAGIVNTPVFAAASTDSLQQQVTELKQELASLKQELKTSHTDGSSTQVKKKRHGKKSASRSYSAPMQVAPAANNGTPPQLPGPSSLPSIGSTSYLPIDLGVPGQSFVSSGPYLGVPLEYDGSNLIVNSPSINEDVLLLKMRKNINERLAALGMQNVEDKSHLLLSGVVEGQASYISHGKNSSSSDIDLSSAILDAYMLGPSKWTSGLIEFAYDNAPGTATGSLFNNSRTENSRVFVNKAFIILGDLTQSPVYGTIGQMYVPFGQYSTSMVSSPLTKLLARTKARAINIGYQPLGPTAPYAAIYAFQGDSHGSSTSRINNGGINIGYRLHQEKFSEDIGAGVIGNIADSQVMQDTGGQTSAVFGGFGATGTCTLANGTTGSCGNEKLVHRVPAYDLRAKFSVGSAIDLIAEYIRASTQFHPNDLTYNSHGAHPQALHTEAIYSFQAFDRPNSIGVGYDMTKDALALQLPAKRMSLVLNTSIWRSTLESLEFRHDINYGTNATGTGSQVATPVTTNSITGRSNNTVTAQIDLYF